MSTTTSDSGLRRQVGLEPRPLGAADCTCVYSCADDKATACTLSGEFHTHPSEQPGDGFGACPIHPSAPGDV